MAICRSVSGRSPDTSTKLGAVIIGPDKEIRSTGYNGFVRGVNDNVPERFERPGKYRWFEHSERNAIYNAARVGTPLKGCTLYNFWSPCSDCSRAIIQSGIIEVVLGTAEIPSRHIEDFSVGLEMIIEAGGKVRLVNSDEAVTRLVEVDD
jgi:dCMP deaminase